MKPTPLARCPVKGCPMRYRSGPDRACAGHRAEGLDPDIEQAAAEFAVFVGEPHGLRSGASQPGRD